jgi:hypothetical protein
MSAPLACFEILPDRTFCVDEYGNGSPLELAWATDAEIARTKRHLDRLEKDRAILLDAAREHGETEFATGHGIVRLVVSPGTRTRVLDVEAFRKNYPKEFKKVATYSVKLTDAERVLGTPLLGELCTVREGSERIKLDFEATFDPLAPREETDA